MCQVYTSYLGRRDRKCGFKICRHSFMFSLTIMPTSRKVSSFTIVVWVYGPITQGMKRRRHMILFNLTMVLGNISVRQEIFGSTEPEIWNEDR